MYTVVNHPLLQHKIAVLRDKNTVTKEFRELANEITMLLTYEALQNLETETRPLETPLARTEGEFVRDDIVVVPVLRAGVGMLDAMLHLIPEARIGFVGLYRDPQSKQPVEYYEKLPDPDNVSCAVIVDPMLATGGSLIATVELLQRKGFAYIKIICIIAAPEGVHEVEKHCPDVEIYTGSLDERLDEHKYIVPGLGDAGDRLYGTR